MSVVVPHISVIGSHLSARGPPISARGSPCRHEGLLCLVGVLLSGRSAAPDFIIGPEQGSILYTDIIEQGVTFVAGVAVCHTYPYGDTATENGLLDRIHLAWYPVPKGLLS